MMGYYPWSLGLWLPLFWFGCVVLAGVIASRKSRSVLIWVILSLFFGPVVLFLLLLLPGVRPQDAATLSSGNIAPSRYKAELEEIKSRFQALGRRIESLEAALNSALPQTPAASETPQETPPAQAPAQMTPAAEQPDLETSMGRFWLNKIGIAVFTLGIAFLISYTFKYFGPIAKIIFGFIVSAALFFFGFKLEKKGRFVNYGRVLLGGAWAIAYFTTYAMYHFEASKIMDNQLLNLCLLAVVATGIIVHSLKYKSQELSGIALFMGYLTATMGDVTVFSFLACVVLALAVLVLVYRMQWYRLIFWGIALTYLTHLVWVVRHIYFSFVPVSRFNARDVYFLINLGFLSVYWAIFTLGIHLMKEREDDEVCNKLSVANLCNILLYFFLAYPKLAAMYVPYKFTFVCGLGAAYLVLSYVMERLKNNKLFTSNMLIALSLLTLAVPLRCMAYHTSVVWLIELPFVFVFGVYFERRAFRYFSFALALLLLWKIVIVDFATMGGVINVFRFKIGWSKFLTCLGFISLGMCVAIARYAKTARCAALSEAEKSLFNIFSILAVIFLTLFLWLVVDLQWLSLAVFGEALVLFLCAGALRDGFLRLCALLVFAMVSFRFLFIDNYAAEGDCLKWTVLSCQVVVSYALYFLYRELKDRKLVPVGEAGAVKAVFCVATLLFTYAMFHYILRSWISLALGAEGVVLFIGGFLARDKVWRVGGFVVFAITVGRVIFVDLSMLHVVYKIVSFIILGLLFLGVSYAYTKYNVSKTKQ